MELINKGRLVKLLGCCIVRHMQVINLEYYHDKDDKCWKKKFKYVFILFIHAYLPDKIKIYFSILRLISHNPLLVLYWPVK